jgi:prevent-host-death family protein
MAMYHGHMVEVTATEFKRNALKLLEQVRVSAEAVQITKRGRPIAQLVRVDETRPRRASGQFRGDAKTIGAIVGSIVDDGD